MPVCTHAVAVTSFLLLVVWSPLAAGQEPFRVADWAPAKSLEATYTEGGPSLLAEIEEVLGGEHRRGTEQRVTALEGQLRPIFLSMPKNEYGNLGHATVRYTLHRYFVGTHGWSVRGLDIAGGAWNGSSPIELLKGRVPLDVQAVFEARLGGRGLGLRELAILASTLEQLVREDSVAKLRALYGARGNSTTVALNGSEVEDVMCAYWASHILEIDLLAAELPPWETLTGGSVIWEVYPSWYKTKEFLHEIRISAESRIAGNFSFHEVVAALEDAQLQWVPVAHVECRNIKRKLLELEDHKSGCVRLADFYGAMLHKGVWQFSESPDYLRQSGLIDESDPQNPRVIIANYVNAPGNCVAKMGMYSVCCLNECESLLGSLESSLQAPEATPAKIAEHIAALPSASMPANRTLSPLLLHHLDEVAERHGGKVRLHGRLFAQWMHFAYPRECPFPRIAGTSSALKPWEYEQKTGKPIFVSITEAYQIAKHSGDSDTHHAANGTCALWDRAEELYVHFRPPVVTTADLEQDESVWAAMHNTSILAAMACLTLLLLRTCQTASRVARSLKVRSSAEHKHLEVMTA